MQSAEPQLVAAIALAQIAAKAAGHRLAEARHIWASVDSQEGRDIKLRADREAEQLILNMLRAETDYPILAEESGGAVATGSDYCWVVDPLDGSHNYMRGVPMCCVSIALCRGAEPVFGCIYDFNHDECFSGGPGYGLSLNGVEYASPAMGDILATGLPRKGDFSAQRLAEFGPHVAKWRQIRLIGSAALSLAWVAAGRFDAYEEAGILWWDVAAGVALVSAVGGRVSVEGERGRSVLDVRAYRQ